MIDSQQMPTRLQIKSILERHGISIYALQKKTEEQGRRISYQALHTLVNNSEPDSIRLNTLDAVLLALRDLTGEKLTICDLLNYES